MLPKKSSVCTSCLIEEHGTTKGFEQFQKYFCSFLAQMKLLKSPLKIKWPLLATLWRSYMPNGRWSCVSWDIDWKKTQWNVKTLLLVWKSSFYKSINSHVFLSVVGYLYNRSSLMTSFTDWFRKSLNIIFILVRLA